MPANLSPEYKLAETAYRAARDPEERLTHLREMLRTIPKHKGTEHLQADIKSRIKLLTEEVAGPKKGGARGGVTVAVRPEGAGQVALLGPPSSGKSSLHARLTGSSAAVGPYPFTTKAPQAGMLPFEDVLIQLVDLPPISADYMEGWMPNAMTHAEVGAVVVDLSEPSSLDDVALLRGRLASKHVLLEAGATPSQRAEDDPFSQRLKMILVASKSDRLAHPEEELAVFRELLGLPELPAVAVSTTAETGLDTLGAQLFDLLGVVRIYTKLPGHPPDMGRPFTVRRGDTVKDVAKLVHRGLAGDVKSARVWGKGRSSGQQVSRDFTPSDKDVIELHW